MPRARGVHLSTASFLGAAIAILVFGERVAPMLRLAALLLGADGDCILPMRHEHQRTHYFDRDDANRTAVSTRAPIMHAHPHYPDVHHQHEHRGAPTWR